ncbi:MAG: hypothetical protein KGQ46_11725 [Hyphomicrobiales bacterium]|nr:hypothetical protein [Hyphomicrobiales bacterium]MDE2113738.1 hypothetical protein [Hyphomicrobiales bacterium]
MKFVGSGGEPRAYIEWKRKNRDVSPLPFDALEFPKDEVKAALLRKQGWICPYTLLEIAEIGTCHIEHVQPQSRCPDLAAEFSNMIACFPLDGAANIGFGAPEKKDKDGASDNFLSPFDPSCEVSCLYQQDGRVVGADQRAVHTICKVLNLNHDSLKEKRLAAFRARGITVRPSKGRVRRPAPASLRQAQDLVSQIMLMDGSGKLASFCVAIRQVAQFYACTLQDSKKKTRQN